MQDNEYGRKKRGGIQQSKGPRRDKGGKRLIFRRTVILMVVCGVLIFLPLIWQLWDLAVLHHDEYGQRAGNQQTKNISVAANRGEILDTNGDVLAMSATVYLLILSPLDVIERVDEKKYTYQDGTLDQASYQEAIDVRRQILALGICEILPELSYEGVMARMEKTYSQYEILMDDIEEDQADRLRLFMAEQNCGYDLWLTPDSKRYYPYGALGASLIGFVNDIGGATGVEAAMEQDLKGIEGRVVTAKTGQGVEMYNSYSSFENASDGNTVTLTLDATIQSYAERALAEGIEAFDIQKGGFIIVMDPQTGALLASASAPGFDLNNYSAIIDPYLVANVESTTQSLIQSYLSTNPTGMTIEEITTQAEQLARSEARDLQWRNLGFQNTYEPGSTFKPLVVAAAIEEGLLSLSDTFTCTGSMTVAGVVIRCGNRTGHGTQTLVEALETSCNPALMMIGERLGIDGYYDYFEGYGLNETTGFDIPGEYNGLMWPRDSMTSVDLAVGSFGQRFQVSPLQMITAFSSVINGGYLYEPYIIQSVSEANGTVISQSEPTMVRQVISQQTSSMVATMLESVVANGSGKNAKVAGYSIGGKTGTSETLSGDDVTVSFIGFSPIEEPEIVVLIGFHTPQRASAGSNYSTTGHYISGGSMAAVMAGPLIADILDYKGLKPSYGEDEIAMAEISVPKITDLTLEEGISVLISRDLNYRTIGEGDVVTAQVPSRGSTVSGGSTVILYLGDAQPEESATTPNLYGMTYAQAKETLESRGLFLCAENYVHANTSVIEQSIPAGESVALGTVVSLVFTIFEVVE